MLYARKFFKTKEAAKAFQKAHGGVLYADVPNSRTRQDYAIEAALGGLTASQREARPYCVAWNIVDEGPIEPDFELSVVTCDTCSDAGHCPEYAPGEDCVLDREWDR